MCGALYMVCPTYFLNFWLSRETHHAGFAEHFSEKIYSALPNFLYFGQTNMLPHKGNPEL